MQQVLTHNDTSILDDLIVSFTQRTSRKRTRSCSKERIAAHRNLGNANMRHDEQRRSPLGYSFLSKISWRAARPDTRTNAVSFGGITAGSELNGARRTPCALVRRVTGSFGAGDYAAVPSTIPYSRGNAVGSFMRGREVAFVSRKIKRVQYFELASAFYSKLR